MPVIIFDHRVNNNNNNQYHGDKMDEETSESSSSSDEELAIASAEEYAVKIAKLQQACLIPLKEDLAEWLNKILEMSNITTENFMDKLDNGVIICRLARIISLWCEQHEKRTSIISNTNTKIWEDAKCRTFYARDNVCNFLKWSKDFGVNRSVLFESDDLVLHANPRQVVLCLLDVARIAYVKYGFTEAPGLVKFEQEIDKELQATENNILLENGRQTLEISANSHSARTSCKAGAKQTDDFYRDGQIVPSKNGRASGRLMETVPIDATDKLVMRYCRHKEEEAARKKNEELAALALAEDAKQMALTNEQMPILSNDSKLADDSQQQQISSNQDISTSSDSPSSDDRSSDNSVLENRALPETHRGDDDVDAIDTLMSPDYNAIVSSTTCDLRMSNTKNLADTGRIDSLDSGEGPTESASTGHSSQLLAGNLANARKCNPSGTNHTSIPVPMKRTNYTPSQMSYQTESSVKSELSSSRSSLLSNQDGDISNSNYDRQATSDLDGKVMRIAKSYYGKKATKDVTRLSEGKYKIADRIVFVRLLKGHRVMVRIGGGWDTLENFLFRHKSDPSQVIDPDNLLPLETKMPFDKTPQATPTKSTSKLPYYRLSNSASSNNLSLSNLSTLSHSLVSSSTTRIAHHHNRDRSGGDVITKPEQSSPSIMNHHRSRQSQNSNQLSAHNNSNTNNKGQTNVTDNLVNQRPMAAHDHLSPSHHQSNIIQKNRILQAISMHNIPANSQIKRPFYYQKSATPYTTNKYNHQRPLASSMTQTVSATNIHLYDSPVRSQAPRRDRGPNRKLLLK